MTDPANADVVSSRPSARLVFVLEQALGHAVHGRNLEEALSRETDVSTDVIRIFQRSGLTSRLPVLKTWSFQASTATRTALRRRLACNDADALFIHTQVSSLLVAGMMKRVPTVLSMDATPINYDSVAEGYGHETQAPAIERAKRWTNRRVFNAATAIVTWSRWAADSVVNDYGISPDKVRVISPGVDLDRWRPAVGARPPGPVRVLFVGDDMVRKGGQDLLAALGLIGVDLELDMVTNAPVEAPLPPGVTVRVHRGLDHTSPALFDLYRSADIFALPSRAECFGLVFCEAMASGLPVIGCHGGAVAELVVDGVNGILVPPKSPEHLAKALSTLAADAGQRARFGESSRRMAEKDHDAVRNARAIIDLMKSLPGREPQTRAASRAVGRAMLRTECPQKNEQSRLMLVSAKVDDALRADVAAGLLPCPEYLRLERRHGVQLYDWTALRGSGEYRSVVRSVAHAAGALRRLRHVDVVFSDGEHVGIPLAVGMTALRKNTPHLVIGHHLDTPAKAFVFRWLRPDRRMDRIIVHSPNQLDRVARDLGPLAARLHVVPYGVDTDFWSPQPESEHDALVVSAGRDHRDYRCLLEACPPNTELFIADHSFHSPGAVRREPDIWPDNIERRALSRLELRRRYSQASVVVVPVIDTPYPFGITTVLEAMSMGKAVVVSDTDGLRGIIEHARTGMVVPAGDVLELRHAIEDLLADPARRAAVGQAARTAAIERFGLDRYVDTLAGHLEEIGVAGRAGLGRHAHARSQGHRPWQRRIQ